MLSYRHSFHAGNFADILKHCVLIQVLQYLKNKDKAFYYLDTHAGAGLYSLSSEQAKKTQEFQQGIKLLWEAEDAPELVAEYIQLIKSFNPDNRLEYYPGSPLIAQHLMRRQDHLSLYELHNTDIGLLEKAIGGDKRVQVQHQDGFKQCLGLMPPMQKRGLVLIDPSYEIKADYDQVFTTLVQLYKRFASGTYLLWYPVVERERIHALEQKIQASSLRNVQLFELGIVADSHAPGMTASGMIIVNPPWTLVTEMQTTLAYLADKLGLAQQGYYRIVPLQDE